MKDPSRKMNVALNSIDQIQGSGVSAGCATCATNVNGAGSSKTNMDNRMTINQ